jgi:hypothetical protein
MRAVFLPFPNFPGQNITLLSLNSSSDMITTVTLQVRAVKVDEDARKEAGIERQIQFAHTESSTSATSGATTTAAQEEEVFIAQLHRRARLLNADFQARVLELVLRRQAKDVADYETEQFNGEARNAGGLSCGHGSERTLGMIQHSTWPDAAMVFPGGMNLSRLYSSGWQSISSAIVPTRSCSSFNPIQVPEQDSSHRTSCLNNLDLQERHNVAVDSEGRCQALSYSFCTDLGSLGTASTLLGEKSATAESCQSDPMQYAPLMLGTCPQSVEQSSFKNDSTMDQQIIGSQTVSTAGLTAVEVGCVFAEGLVSKVSVCPAPRKMVPRMREKLAEYATEGAAWPLTAQILDPVRVSVVCQGPVEMLEVARWFLEDEVSTAGNKEQPQWLPVCRVKNKFALRMVDLVRPFLSVDSDVGFQ